MAYYIQLLGSTLSASPNCGLLKEGESRYIHLLFAHNPDTKKPDQFSVKALPINHNQINESNLHQYYFNLEQLFNETNINLMFTIETIYLDFR